MLFTGDLKNKDTFVPEPGITFNARCCMKGDEHVVSFDVDHAAL